jgi:hypothetical protein
VTEHLSAEDFVHGRRSDEGRGEEEPIGATPRAEPSSNPPAVIPDGTFVKVAPGEHPLPRASEVSVYLQDYHRSSSKLGRFGKIIGIDEQAREYLLMLDNFDSIAVPMRRVEWRKTGT